MDHLNSFLSTKTPRCFLLSLLAFSLQLLMLFETTLSFSFIGSHNSTSSSNCLHHEKSTLLQLKHGSLIDRRRYYSSSQLDSWNPATDCCSWDGITCDKATGHVIGLDLSSSLRATSSWIVQIDSSLFNLRSLQKLDLSWNNFYPDPIPSGLGHLTNLTHLNLSYARFSGEIPLEILRLTKLVSLDLSDYFHIPYGNLELKNSSLTTLIGNLSSLQELFLDRVTISGEHGGKWAQAISITLPNLLRLSLRGCRLQGPIDPSLFQIPSLSQLSLDGNNLSIVVPEFLYESSALTSLTLSDCGLYGKVPESIFLMPNLEKLDISYNPHLIIDFSEFPQNKALQTLHMENISFQKKMLSSIINLKFLKDLSLWNSNLSGFLPSSIANLTQLEYLDLSSNNFSGTIPSSYLYELKHLVSLNLDNNSLERSIPLSLFSHPALQYLSLSNNKFSGWLPDFYNESSSFLEEIFLDNNNLQGPIPSLFFELTHLEYLSLSNNYFTGIIGLHMFQKSKNLSSLDLSDNKLSFINGNDSSHLISSSQIEHLSLRSCNISEFPIISQNPGQLAHLDLSKNKLHGEIPTWIWKAVNGSLIYLNLSNNFLESFEHPLPQFSSTVLGAVDFHSNKLQGSLPVMPHEVIFHDYSNNNFSSIIPAAINFTFIEYFFLSGNNVSGEIPSSICNARFLRFLDLSRNNFSGNIPTCLGEIGNSLKVLNLQRNAFHGTVPDTFKKDCNLRTLHLDNNELEGRIPNSLANCKTLEVIDLGNNHLNDSFPFWFDSLSNLRILILQSNKLHGPIAHPHLKNFSFQFLQIFDISSNYFVGIVPPNFFLNWKLMAGGGGLDSSSNVQVIRYAIEFGIYNQDSVMVTMKGLHLEVVKIITALTSVDLSNNRFQGQIPNSIVNLKLLRMLNFSQNSFNGSIPASLENLTVLESFDLSRNNLSGTIPWELTKLTFLAVLNLSQNLLHGRIPQSHQFLTFTESSFLGNIGLCGLPLSTKCEDTVATPPSAFCSFGLDGVGEIDLEFMWMGFGIGVAFGFGAIIWTLALWRRGSRKYMQLIDRMFVCT